MLLTGARGTCFISLLTLGVAVALLGSACVFGGGGDSTASPAPDSTPAATATSEPTTRPTAVVTATPTAELPPGLEASARGTWEQRELRAGDEVPDVLGAYLFEVGAGVGTLWSLAADAVEDPTFVLVEASPNGEYVVALGSPNHSVNTATGDSFTWGPRAQYVTVDDGGLALFRAISRCEFWVADLSGEEPRSVATFELPGDRTCNVDAGFSPDGSALLVALQGNNVDGGATLLAVELGSAEVTEVRQVEPTHLRFKRRDLDGVVALIGTLAGTAWIAEYDWAARELTEHSIATGEPLSVDDKDPPHPGRLTPSPDGRWIAWSETADLGLGQGAGGLAEWPVTVIASIDGSTPLIVADRVALSSGIVGFDWLADSSAVVVQSEDGFALLGTDGTLEALPFSVAAHTDPVPRPAPDTVARFAYGGRVVAADGATLGEVPAVAEAWGRATETGPDSWWIATSYRWSDHGDRLILVRTEVLGGDFGRGGVAVLGLPARITTGARSPDSAIELRVAADGDRLNVRVGPSIDAERLGQFDDGAVVTIGRDASLDFCGPNGCSIVSDETLDYGEGWWVYVVSAGTEGDLAGWVSSEFLGWS